MKKVARRHASMYAESVLCLHACSSMHECTALKWCSQGPTLHVRAQSCSSFDSSCRGACETTPHGRQAVHWPFGIPWLCRSHRSSGGGGHFVTLNLQKCTLLSHWPKHTSTKRSLQCLRGCDDLGLFQKEKWFWIIETQSAYWPSRVIYWCGSFSLLCLLLLFLQSNFIE